MNEKPKILYVTPVLMYPVAGGPALRVESSIKALKDISELHVIARRSKYQTGGAKAVKYYRQLTYQIRFTPLEENIFFSYLLHKSLGAFRRLTKRSIDPLNLDIITKIDARFIISYARRNNINIIWFSFGNISYDLLVTVKKLAPSLKLVCDTDSVWSRFILRELPFETDDKRKRQIEAAGRKKEREEVGWVEICDITTAVSEVDSAFYRTLTDRPEKILPFSNVIDLDKYTNRFEVPDNFKKPGIFIAGTFYVNSPMDKATRWFVNYVLPLVQQKVQDAHLYVIGIGSDITLSDIHNDSVSITGLLDNVLPYLTNADVAIVPLQFESGTRFKILEAAACGIPIVSTKLGAEGIPVVDGIHVAIADTETEFADAVIRMILDKPFANSVAENCKGLVHKGYSIEHLKKEGRVILNLLNNE